MSAEHCSIRTLAKLIGKYIACAPAVPHAALFSKRLEIYRNDMLRFHKGNYDSMVKLPLECVNDIRWWITNLPIAEKSVICCDFDIAIFTDSSLEGWGIVMNEKSSGGQWDNEERENHINYLELKAVLLGLKTFCRELHNIHIRVRSDNTVTVICINRQGSTKAYLNDITRDIWSFAIERNIWLSAEHVKGSENIQADKESRQFNSDTEWMLNTNVFDSITKVFGVPDFDLFASRINHQVPLYYSWRADPNAVATDAFMHKWSRN